MYRYLIYRLMLILVSGIALLIAACNSGVGSSGVEQSSNPLIAIEINPVSQTLPLATNEQYTAIGIYQNNTIADITDQVTWSSKTPKIARVSESGEVTTVSSGLAIISATLNNITVTSTLIVSNATLKSISISATSPVVAMGTSTQIVAIGTYTDNKHLNITGSVNWNSGSPSVVAISRYGEASGLIAGTSQVTASMSGITSNTVSLTVSSASLKSILISATNTKIALGTNSQFDAMGVFSDGTTQDISTTVLWSSSSPATATISNKTGTQGLVISVAAGTSQVTASMSGITSNTVPLTVSSASLKSILISATNTKIALGTNSQFDAMGVFSDGTTQDISTTVLWSSSSLATATISNKTGTQGLVTSVAAGTSQITASMSGITSNTVPLTVSSASLKSILISATNTKIALGTNSQFDAMGVFSDGTTQDISTTVLWSSSSLATATISNKTGTQGLVTSVAAGTSQITASMSGITSNTVPLTVSSATIVSIVVNPTTTSIVAGGTQQYVATAKLTDSTTQNITSSVLWSSTNPAIATISNVSGSQGLASGISAGTSQIQAIYGNISSSPVTLTITGATMVGLLIYPNNPTISTANGSIQLYALAKFSDGSTQNVLPSGCTITWSKVSGSDKVVNGGTDTSVFAATAIDSTYGVVTAGALTGGSNENGNAMFEASCTLSGSTYTAQSGVYVGTSFVPYPAIESSNGQSYPCLIYTPNKDIWTATGPNDSVTSGIWGDWCSADPASPGYSNHCYPTGSGLTAVNSTSMCNYTGGWHLPTGLNPSMNNMSLSNPGGDWSDIAVAVGANGSEFNMASAMANLGFNVDIYSNYWFSNYNCVLDFDDAFVDTNISWGDAAVLLVHSGQ